MNRKLAIAIVCLVFATWAVAQAAPNEQITKGPVVENVSGNIATIAWSTNTGGSSVVRYGTDPNNLNQISQSPYVDNAGTHRVQLHNLQPGATYYYQVVSGQGQGTGTMALSQVNQFTVPGGQQAQSAQSASGHMAVYRGYNASDGAHMFATNPQDVRSQGFRSEGVAFYVSSSAAPGEVPLYHVVNANGDEFYTTNTAERDRLINSNGYHDAGALGYVASTQQPGTVPLYRFYNPKLGKHMYSTNASEISRLPSEGWQQEGVIGYVWQQ